MKFLVELGKQLDLNVAWDGGLPDNVTYQVSSNDNAVTITNDGVVSGINVGIAVVKFINSGGVEVGSAIFEVMTAQQYEKVNALRSGTKTLTVEAVEVPTTPPAPTLVSASQDGFAIGDSFADGGDVNGAFNGLIGTNSSSDLWITNWTFASNTNAWLGRIFPVRTQIKRVRLMFCTAPTQVVFQYTDDPQGVWTDIGAPVTVTQYETYDAGTNTISNRVWMEYDLSSYPAAFAFRMKCHTTATIPGTAVAHFSPQHIDRFRVWEMELFKDQVTFLSSKFSKNDMTQNEQSGYKAFAYVGEISNDTIYSHTLQGNSYKMFDGDRRQPLFFGGGSGMGSNYKWYVGQVMPAQKKIKRYSVSDTGYHGANGKSIRKWILQGSQNTTTGIDGDWVTLDTQDIQNDKLKYFPYWYGPLTYRVNNNLDNSLMTEKRYFELPSNNTQYVAYRLVVLPASDGYEQQLIEVEFYEA